MSTKRHAHDCNGEDCPKRDDCAHHLLRESDATSTANVCEHAERQGKPPYSKFDLYIEHPVRRLVPQSEWAGAPIAARASASVFWLAAA